MRIQFSANVLNDVVHGTASDLAFLDLTGTAVDDFVPLRFGVGVLLRIEAGDELTGQMRPVGGGEGQHFGNLCSGDAHTLEVSTVFGGSTSARVHGFLIGGGAGHFALCGWAFLRIVGSVMRVALITGASRGIGRGIALELATLGFDLALNYRSNAEAAGKTLEDCLAAGGGGIRAAVFPADVGRAPDRARLLDFVRERFGRLDLLVNNAGIAPRIRADILEATEESFDELLTTNVKGPYFLTQATARWMIEQRAQLDEGYAPKIVTISSVSAYTASVNRGDYCISKAALSMVTALYASRLAEHEIGVYEIRPGIISTDMTAGVKEKYDRLLERGLSPIRRWGQPEDVAKAVGAIASGAFPFSTGEVINVDGGFHLRTL